MLRPETKPDVDKVAIKVTIIEGPVGISISNLSRREEEEDWIERCFERKGKIERKREREYERGDRR